MFPQMLLALLSDASGRVLLVRRKESLLWTLPGCIVRHPIASRTDLLVSCCRRQIGVAPDFVSPLASLEFSGHAILVGVDQILAARVRACGRMAESQWFQPDSLPMELAPIAGLAVAQLGSRVAVDFAHSALVGAC